MREAIIEDKELGRLIIRLNPRAQRFIFRTKEDAIYVTVPLGATQEELNEVIEELRSELSASRKQVARKQIDLSYQINTEFFKLTLVSGERNEFLAHSELGKMQIVCPPTANFEEERLQSWLRKVIEEGLKRNAKVVLPSRLYMLANQHGLFYGNVKINASKGQWGSCSGKKNINLSCYLMLLPAHLIDYVLLHELTHTLEMNHSERFWALLNQYTDGKSLALRKKLKEYKTEV
ncbi:SprT family zinc-dependent metalloprotease [Bacteroides sp. 224]|uniref:YgjP family zinc-dependent metalloprotease n=1 Tax=Bacteroides sp. 224 TaxID=2302936 RepID=UPI0013D57A57|nr:SprT family zinc-dependent metalloprotease [Bacteroides sp. 224]NDV64284.1 M48 family peptidase [Bacteroides sp. 224]